MLNAQNMNEVRTITDTAARCGVKLPADLAAQAAHLHALEAQHRTATTTTPTTAAAELSAHLGNPDALDKARRTVAAQIATDEASARITGALVDRCGALLRQRMRARGDEIAAAFAGPLQAAVDVLNTDAGTLPADFEPADAATLTPEAYAAWVRVRDALALIETVRAALRPLYGTPTDDMLTAPAVRALAVVVPPEFTTTEDAHTFARALAGVRLAGSSLGPVALAGVLMPTAVARLGATFAWGTPTEVESRAALIRDAAVTVRDDTKTRAVVVRV